MCRSVCTNSGKSGDAREGQVTAAGQTHLPFIQNLQRLFISAGIWQQADQKKNFDPI